MQLELNFSPDREIYSYKRYYSDVTYLTCKTCGIFTRIYFYEYYGCRGFHTHGCRHFNGVDWNTTYDEREAVIMDRLDRGLGV